MTKSQKMFDCLSRRMEQFLSTFRGSSIYFLFIAVCYLVWDWDGADRYIYVTTAFMFVLLIGQNRRNSEATHAKLDRLTPDNTLNRLEERSEEEIEQMRKDATT